MPAGTCPSAGGDSAVITAPPAPLRAAGAALDGIPSDDVDPAGPVAWFDGRFVPAGEASIAVGDAGFVLGTTVTEQLRTFHGKPFLSAAHALRFRRSAAIVGIEPPPDVERIFAAAEVVAARSWNALCLPTGGDLGLIVLATPGDLPAQHGGRRGTPRVVVHAFPLAFAMWAAAYGSGVSIRCVSVEQIPDACWPLALKCRSRMHYHLADREAHAAEPGARALLRHADGRVSETSTANVAIVRRGEILTPPAGDALAGISLAHARGLAAEEGIPWREATLRAHDLAAADEILLTSTPWCLLAATRFDGEPVGDGRPGPVYRRLLGAWSRSTGLDIAAQAASHAAHAAR